jgi:hypothetical protein
MKTAKYINISAKLVLFGLFTHYLLNPELPQYHNKGMAWRLIFYPLIVMMIPLICFLRRSKMPYPHLTDMFITLPFVADMLGNTLNLFDRIVWWDDLMHFVLWASWVLAAGTFIRITTNLPRLAVAGLTVGFGAVSSILWELGEYLTFVPGNPMEGPKAYRDTMGDEALSLLGSIVGAIIISTLLWQIVSRKLRKR